MWTIVKINRFTYDLDYIVNDITRSKTGVKKTNENH